MRWFAPQRSTQTISRLRCKEAKQFSRARCAPGPRSKRLKEQRGSLPGLRRSIARSRSPFSNAFRHEVLVRRGRPSRYAHEVYLHKVATIDESARRWSLHHLGQNEARYADRIHNKEVCGQSDLSNVPLAFNVGTGYRSAERQPAANAGSG